MGWDSKEVADKILFAIGGTACQSNASYFPHFHILAGVLQQFVIHGKPGRPLFYIPMGLTQHVSIPKGLPWNPQ